MLEAEKSRSLLNCIGRKTSDKLCNLSNDWRAPLYGLINTVLPNSCLFST